MVCSLSNVQKFHVKTCHQRQPQPDICLVRCSIMSLVNPTPSYHLFPQPRPSRRTKPSYLTTLPEPASRQLCLLRCSVLLISVAHTHSVMSALWLRWCRVRDKTDKPWGGSSTTLCALGVKVSVFITFNQSLLCHYTTWSGLATVLL